MPYLIVWGLECASQCETLKIGVEGSLALLSYQRLLDRHDPWQTERTQKASLVETLMQNLKPVVFFHYPTFSTWFQAPSWEMPLEMPLQVRQSCVRYWIQGLHVNRWAGYEDQDLDQPHLQVQQHGHAHQCNHAHERKQPKMIIQDELLQHPYTRHSELTTYTTLPDVLHIHLLVLCLLLQNHSHCIRPDHSS